MAGDMKAVITLTADASGVQAGVDRAMAGLNKMAGAVQAFRSGIAGGMLADVFQFAKSSFDSISQRVTDAAHMYSPLAHSSQIDLAMTEQQTNKQLGQAFGPVVALVDGIKAQGLRDAANYIADNKESIGKTMENLAVLGIAIEDVSAQLAVRFSNSLNQVADWVSNPVDSAMAIPKASHQIFIGAAEAIAGQSAAQWLERIYQKLGGS